MNELQGKRSSDLPELDESTNNIVKPRRPWHIKITGYLIEIVVGEKIKRKSLPKKLLSTIITSLLKRCLRSTHGKRKNFTTDKIDF